MNEENVTSGLTSQSRLFNFIDHSSLPSKEQLLTILQKSSFLTGEEGKKLLEFASVESSLDLNPMKLEVPLIDQNGIYYGELRVIRKDMRSSVYLDTPNQMPFKKFRIHDNACYHSHSLMHHGWRVNPYLRKSGIGTFLRDYKEATDGSRLSQEHAPYHSLSRGLVNRNYVPVGVEKTFCGPDNQIQLCSRDELVHILKDKPLNSDRKHKILVFAYNPNEAADFRWGWMKMEQ